MGKYDNWEIVFAHPLVGRLTWRKSPPGSLILLHIKEASHTAFLSLEWRDMRDEIAYYNVVKFVSDRITGVPNK